MIDQYYNSKEVSNSDLTEMWKHLIGEDTWIDYTRAFAFGSLVDAMITEPHHINSYRRTFKGEKVDEKDWNLAIQKRDLFLSDPVAKHYVEVSRPQAVFRKPALPVEAGGFKFTLPMRCRYDLYQDIAKRGCEIKTTSAKTLDEFYAACIRFDYFRARALYMDLSDSEGDIIIGISKKKDELFTIPIKRGDDLYKMGKERYSELAFKWFTTVV